MNAPNLRSEKGMSLVMVLALGVIATLWMLSTIAITMPTFQRIAINRTKDVMRDGAELSLDWALGQLDNASTRSTIDAQSGQTQTTTVPSGVLPSNMSSYTATVSIANTDPPSYSSLYSPNFTGTSIQGISGFRIVTATLSNPAGTWHKSVQVILMPTYNPISATSTSVTTSTSSTTGPPTAIFEDALAAPGAIGGVGNAITNSYNSQTNPNPTTFVNKYGDISTNTDSTFTKNSSIGGNVNVFSTGTNGVTVDSGGTVYGSVNANGTVSGVTFANDGIAGDPTGQANQNLSNPPMQFASVPAAPPTAVSLGVLSLSGKTTLTLANGYYMINGTKYTTAGGDYIANSLSMTGQAQIIVDNSNGPINLFVQGSGSNNGIQIGGNGIASSGANIPGDFRIWYGGTGSVSFSGNGSVSGVVYAPNAPFQMVGNGTLYGALVANTINLTGNGTFHYDQELQHNTSLMWNPTVTTTSQQTTTSTVHSDVFTHFQAVSWCEF